MRIMKGKIEDLNISTNTVNIHPEQIVRETKL